MTFKCKIKKVDIFYYGYVQMSENQWVSITGPCYTKIGVKHQLKKWKKKKTSENEFYI